MRPAVNGAGAGAALGRYIPDNGKRRGRGFPDDGEHTFAAGGEYQLQPFIESHAVTPIADRQFGDHGAIVASMTTSCLSQPAKSRLVFKSMARPVGPS